MTKKVYNVVDTVVIAQVSKATCEKKDKLCKSDRMCLCL